MNDNELKDKMDEEDFAEDEEVMETEKDLLSDRGDISDNPYNTRKNHMLTLLWMCLLAAALIGMDYISRTVLK